MEKIYEIIEEKGWKPFCDDCCVSVLVYDKEDYRDLVEVYKQAKKEV